MDWSGVLESFSARQNLRLLLHSPSRHGRCLSLAARGIEVEFRSGRLGKPSVEFSLTASGYSSSDTNTITALQGHVHWRWTASHRYQGWDRGGGEGLSQSLQGQPLLRQCPSFRGSQGSQQRRRRYASRCKIPSSERKLSEKYDTAK